MKDFPMFTTEYGVASLILKEVPYRQVAFVNILEVQENWVRTIQGWINLNFVEYEDQSLG